MKTRCADDSNYGGLVRLTFDIPDQEEVDSGEEPVFFINALDLMCEANANGLHNTYCMFVVDALAVFADEAHDAESAETVAQWLESMASKIRKKFTDERIAQPSPLQPVPAP